jgi:hypothetical protein
MPQRTTSETFLRAWAGRDTIHATTARAYLFTIAPSPEPRAPNRSV